MKFSFALLGAVGALAFGGVAHANMHIGDILDVVYAFPNVSNYQSDSGDIFFYAEGQEFFTGQNSSVTLFSDHISFNPLGGVSFAPADFNGPVVYDLTDDSAFLGWSVLSDTVGITSTYDNGQQYGVNWQGDNTTPDEHVVVGASAAPEPGTWALMVAGLGLAGIALRLRPGSTDAVTEA